RVMIEAVENHMPEVIVVDEIGAGAEAQAARTIAQRGVPLTGPAHGTTLESLLANPTLSDLVGGVQTVILGDEEARMRGTRKTISERKAAPRFDAVVEIREYDRLIVHPDTAGAVDRLLRCEAPRAIGRPPAGDAVRPSAPAPTKSVPGHDRAPSERPKRLYPYAVSRDVIDKVLRELSVDARTVDRPDRADAVIALRSRADDGRLRRIVEAT